MVRDDFPSTDLPAALSLERVRWVDFAEESMRSHLSFRAAVHIADVANQIPADFLVLDHVVEAPGETAALLADVRDARAAPAMYLGDPLAALAPSLRDARALPLMRLDIPGVRDNTAAVLARPREARLLVLLD